MPYSRFNTQGSGTPVWAGPTWNEPEQLVYHPVPTASQISRHSTLALNVPNWEVLPLGSYAGGRGQATGHSVRFERLSGQPFLLRDALTETCADLIDAERTATLGHHVASKLSLRIPFPDANPYTRQITARRSTNRGELVSTKVLARKIAQDMDTYIKRERQAGTPLKYRGMPVELDQLALCELRSVSGGSWVPVLQILTLPDSGERVRTRTSQPRRGGHA